MIIFFQSILHEMSSRLSWSWIYVKVSFDYFADIEQQILLNKFVLNTL